MAAITEKYALGTRTVVLQNGLNGLASGNTALSAEYDNTAGAAGDGYTLVSVELYLDSMGGTPTANTGMSVWFLGAQDDTNYEDGTAGTPGVIPARMPDVVIPIRNVATAQRILRRTWLPWGKLKFLFKNDGTGQAIGANNSSTLAIRPVTNQGV